MVYLTAVKDMATREIVGWYMADHLCAELCCDSLRMALNRRALVHSLLIHTDSGVQFASINYSNIINAAKLTHSMTRKGVCLDHAPLESFFSTLKKEMSHRQRFATRAQAKAAPFEHIGVLYYRQRLHSAIGHHAPE